MEHRIVTIN